jgi:mono/diheme cytochrome c family protein
MNARIACPVLAAIVGACASAPETLPLPSGAETFATHCASCHGAQGEADGPVAAAMRVSMPNLRTLSERNNGTFPAELVSAYIDGRELPRSHGDRYMPVWGDVFDAAGESGGGRASRQRIEGVVEFLRELQYP